MHEPMFNASSITNRKGGSTKRKHQPKVGQHGMIYKNCEITNMKRKTSRYFKKPQLLHDRVSHPTENQSINLQ